MAPKLRVLIALADDPGLAPSTHMEANKHLEFHLQGIQWTLLASAGTTHMDLLTYINTKYSQTLNKQKLKNEIYTQRVEKFSLRKNSIMVVL